MRIFLNVIIMCIIFSTACKKDNLSACEGDGFGDIKVTNHVNFNVTVSIFAISGYNSSDPNDVLLEEELFPGETWSTQYSNAEDVVIHAKGDDGNAPFASYSVDTICIVTLDDCDTYHLNVRL